MAPGRPPSAGEETARSTQCVVSETSRIVLLLQTTGRAGCAQLRKGKGKPTHPISSAVHSSPEEGAEAADKVVNVVAPLDACYGRRRRYKNRCSVAMGDRQRRRPVLGRVTTRVRSKARVCALQGPEVFQTYLTRPANRRSKPTSHPPPPHTPLRTLSKRA